VQRAVRGVLSPRRPALESARAPARPTNGSMGDGTAKNGKPAVYGRRPTCPFHQAVSSTAKNPLSPAMRGPAPFVTDGARAGSPIFSRILSTWHLPQWQRCMFRRRLRTTTILRADRHDHPCSPHGESNQGRLPFQRPFSGLASRAERTLVPCPTDQNENDPRWGPTR